MALGVLDSFEFQADVGVAPNLVHISGDVYAIVYRGPDNDGFVSTVTIDSGGNITEPLIATFEFQTEYIGTPRIYHISGNIYAIIYGDVDGDGWVVTIEISTTGAITDPIVDSHEFDTSAGSPRSMIHISGTTYAIAYTGPDSDGWLKTLTIGNDGSISADPELDSLEFDTYLAYSPYIMHISGDIYAILYAGRTDDPDRDFDWRIVTVDINSVGAIEDTVVDSLFIKTPGTPNHSVTYVGRLYNVAGDIYAFATQGEDSGGVEAVFIYTVEISSVGAIAASETDSSKIALSSNASIDFFKTSGDIYVLAYKSPTDPGGLKTLDIADNGTIGSVTASLTFDSTRGVYPFLLDVTTTVMAIAYTGFGSDGYLKTYGEVIVAPTVTTNQATALSAIAATPNGTLDSDGGEACECGFEWGLSTEYSTITPTESKRTGETFSQVIGGLFPNTTYHFRAFATNPAGTAYGADRSFTTALVISKAYALAREEL